MENYILKTSCGYFDGLRMTANYDFVSDSLDFDDVLEKGFRRSGTIIYRAVCENCKKCVPIRIQVEEFSPSKSQRKVARKNQDAEITIERAQENFVTEEKIALYKKYKSRHSPDEFSDEEIAEELSSIALGFSGTLNMDYRIGGKLVACGIVDCGKNALSSNYFYYDISKENLSRSLGTFSILKEIEFCKKMNYKSRFCPYELQKENGLWEKIQCAQ